MGGGGPVDFGAGAAEEFPNRKLARRLGGWSPDLLKRLKKPLARFDVRSPMKLNPPRL